MSSFIQRLIYHFKGYYTSTIFNILGIAVALAVFSILSIQIFYDWDYDNFHPDSDRIYTIGTINGNGDTLIVMSDPLVHNLMQDYKKVGIEEYTVRVPDITSCSWKAGNEYFASKWMRIDANFPSFFGFKIIAGDITKFQGKGKAILPKSMAIKNWGRIDIVGSKITPVNEVVAVYEDMPSNSLIKNLIYEHIIYDDSNPYYFRNQVFIKVAPDANINNIQSILQKRLTVLNNKVKQEIAKSNYTTSDFVEDSLFLMPIHEIHFNKNMADREEKPISKSSTHIITSLALSILIISIINFTLFNTALVAKKRRTDSLRRALGANRWQRASVVLCESVGICLFAWLISVILIYLASHYYIYTLINASLDLSHNWMIIAISLLIAILIGIIVSLYPIAYLLSVRSSQDIKRDFGLSFMGRLFRNILIGIQFFFSLVLASCGVFMYLQESFMLNYDGGFDKFHITNSYLKDTIKNVDSIMTSLKKLHGVEGATLSRFALGSEDSYINMSNGKFRANTFVVASNYLDVMNIPIIEGRNFNADGSDNYNNVIMNESAQRLHPTEIQVGKYFDERNRLFKIIGICRDFNYFSARVPIGTAMLIPYSNDQLTCVTVKVKDTNDSIVKKAIKDILDKGDAGYDHKVKIYSEILPDTYQTEIQETKRILSLAVISIILCLTGLCGLIVMDNESRIKEYAIRRTFGASSFQILRLATGRYLKILIPAYLISLPISWHYVNIWLNTFAEHIDNAWTTHLYIFIATLAITILWVILFTFAYIRQPPSCALRRE